MNQDSIPTLSNNNSLKKIFQKLLSYWYWVLFCSVLGAAIAYGYSLFQKPIYETTTVLLVNGETKGIVAENLFEGLESKSKFQNHVGILKSYSLNRQVVHNLDWKTTWYSKDNFKRNDLYGKCPFQVRIPKKANNLTGVEIAIYPLDNDYCKIIIGDEENKTVIKVKI